MLHLTLTANVFFHFPVLERARPMLLVIAKGAGQHVFALIDVITLANALDESFCLFRIVLRSLIKEAGEPLSVIDLVKHFRGHFHMNLLIIISSAHLCLRKLLEALKRKVSRLVAYHYILELNVEDRGAVKA